MKLFDVYMPQMIGRVLRRVLRLVLHHQTQFCYVGGCMATHKRKNGLATWDCLVSFSITYGWLSCFSAGGMTLSLVPRAWIRKKVEPFANGTLITDIKY